MSGVCATNCRPAAEGFVADQSVSSPEHRLRTEPACDGAQIEKKKDEIRLAQAKLFDVNEQLKYERVKDQERLVAEGAAEEVSNVGGQVRKTPRCL